jgi:hypothetical protein
VADKSVEVDLLSPGYLLHRTVSLLAAPMAGVGTVDDTRRDRRNR